MGKEIPIDITKLPPQLQERIAIHTEEQSPYLRRLSQVSPETRERLLEQLRKIREA